ncbi:hypothetical protein NP493_225g02004 [Ridgeia piscesae]|uniref:Centrosomal protein 43 n=1 Tax=Ridgeia piscesae TaxID=27915 RepID=A0AAD9P089_RIDPI|nr:hypothetical protein NP493_225g02004 [Ridgeia piscesae]
MSADEDTELRDLVAQTLESNGVLGKIRAQLRASVFLALEEQDTIQSKTPLLNQQLNKFISTKEGQLATSLVREFLQFFNLEYSLSVFEPEVGIGNEYKDRATLARELNVVEGDTSSSLPLLAEIMRRGGGEKLSRTPANSSEDLSIKQIEKARQKFEHYDMDGNGVIDRDELRQLFSDMFPAFHSSMLDRYVNDEFRAEDRDFSNTIDFDEFLRMYKRLFVLCKSVVSHDVSDILVPSPRRNAGLSPSRIPAPLRKPPSSSLHSVSHPSSVESKNRKNSDHSKSHQQPSGSPKSSLSAPQLHHDGAGSDPEDDIFFDDPPQAKNTSFGDWVMGKKDTIEGKDITQGAVGASGTDDNRMSSLAGLPPLMGGDNQASQKVAEMDKDIKSIDKKMADLGFGTPEDFEDDEKYDDDFENSNISPDWVHPKVRKVRPGAECFGRGDRRGHKVNNVFVV